MPEQGSLAKATFGLLQVWLLLASSSPFANRADEGSAQRLVLCLVGLEVESAKVHKILYFTRISNSGALVPVVSF